MQLIIKLNGTSRKEFEYGLKSLNWQVWGWFRHADNSDVIIAQKEEWRYDIKICYLGNEKYDYFVLFTPLQGYEELFDKEPWFLEMLVNDFMDFINVDYHNIYHNLVKCEKY